MPDEAQQFMVRADYSHALMTVSQRFLSSVLLFEPGAFLNAVNSLAQRAPVAESHAEAVMAWFVLKDAITRGAESHHAWFHQCAADAFCLFRVRPPSAPPTFTPAHVISVLNDWAIEYAWGFEAVHCWPPAIRAMELLRAAPKRVWRVADLAKTVHVSCATLERSFCRIFKMTVLQYEALARLRAVVEDVYDSRACIDGILLDHGYRSPKAAYGLCRSLTGMTLSAVRRLSNIEYEALLGGPLALPTARMMRRLSRARTEETKATRKRQSITDIHLNDLAARL
jgi:AraC-like DNA-binding protein